MQREILPISIVLMLTTHCIYFLRHAYIFSSFTLSYSSSAVTSSTFLEYMGRGSGAPLAVRQCNLYYDTAKMLIAAVLELFVYTVNKDTEHYTLYNAL